jgi:hypothetical protein
MASFCRWVGGFLLVISTLGLLTEQYTGAIAAGVLAFVWLFASLLADFIDHRNSQRRRDQPSRQHHPE